MVEFFQTGMGRKYYESDIPRIADALERIATELEKQNKANNECSALEFDKNYCQCPGGFGGTGIVCSICGKPHVMWSASDKCSACGSDMEWKYIGSTSGPNMAKTCSKKLTTGCYRVLIE